MTDVLTTNTGEIPKGALHYSMGTLAAAFTLYNGVALLIRPTRWLAFNTIAYAALVVFEGKQTHWHWRNT